MGQTVAAPGEGVVDIDLAAYERQRDAAPQGPTRLHFGHRTLLTALVVSYAVAAIADALTTWWALDGSGLAAEGNPLMRDAMGFYGLVPVLVMRVIVGVLLVWLLARVSLRGYVFFRLNPHHPNRWLRRSERWYRVRARFYSAYIVLATAVTWLVVGNNLRAVLTGV
jgi:ABC-type spermidine/putrescine transport system permease subunit II